MCCSHQTRDTVVWQTWRSPLGSVLCLMGIQHALFWSDTGHYRMTDLEVSIRQCVVFDGNPAHAVLIRHKILPNGAIKVSLLPKQLYVLSHCRTTVNVSGWGTYDCDHICRGFMAQVKRKCCTQVHVLLCLFGCLQCMLFCSVWLFLLCCACFCFDIFDRLPALCPKNTQPRYKNVLNLSSQVGFALQLAGCAIETA